MPAALVVAGLAAFDNDPPFQTKLFPALVAESVAVALVQVMIFDALGAAITGKIILSGILELN